MRQSLLQRVGCITVVIITLLVGLARLGINVTALVAALGVAVLAFSLAAQDSLSDAIAGFIILANHPFRGGDRIEISGLRTWGDVVNIGLRTRDNRMVIVPNSTIGRNQVINYTYPNPRYRIQEDIGVGYGVDVEKTRRVIVDTVRKVDGVLADKPVEALYVEMGDRTGLGLLRCQISLCHIGSATCRDFPIDRSEFHAMIPLKNPGF